MTTIELEEARRITERAKQIVEDNRVAISDVQKREAHFDRVLATSQIKADQYRQVLRRAGLLKK